MRSLAAFMLSSEKSWSQVIDAHYHSGGAGGGHSTQYRVPKDPQAYARLFIPKDDKK